MNFSDTEIEVFCSRYDVDGNFEFSFEEVRAAIEDAQEEFTKKRKEEEEEDKDKDEKPVINLFMFEG